MDIIDKISSMNESTGNIGSIDDKVGSIYEGVGYLGMYGTDVIISIFLFLLTLAIVSITSYKALMHELRNNWNEHKCKPVLLPFAGLIIPNPGQSYIETTFENFNYCIQQDITSSFSVIMMPLEFINYTIIDFLETKLMYIKYLIEFLSWLRNQFGSIFQEFYNKIINFIVPVIEMILYLRDALDKINGIITTSLFTIMNIYNITVSGVINILTVLVNLLLAVIIVMIALMALAMGLMTNPFTFLIGLPLQILFLVILVGVILPAIIICTMMNNQIRDLFNESSPPPPKRP
jgi:hypothetical protein